MQTNYRIVALILGAAFVVSIIFHASQYLALGRLKTQNANLDVRLGELSASAQNLEAASAAYLSAEGKGCGGGVNLIECLANLTVNLRAAEEGDAGIVAFVIESFEPNRTFTLANHPNVRFTVKRISLASGGIATPRCSAGEASGGQFIFLRYMDEEAASGTRSDNLCLDVAKAKADGRPAGLAVVELEIRNNSTGLFRGTNLLTLYSSSRGEDRLAKGYPTSDTAVPALSSRRVRMGFEVPFDLAEARLVYGDYTGSDFLSLLRRSAGLGASEELFEKSEGGFLVDFKKKTLSELPG